MTRVQLIVPCYNEEARLDRGAFTAFTEANDWVSILFVNDGSRDNSRKMLEDLCWNSPRMQVYHLAENSGKAEAVRQGMLRGLESTDAELIGFWDADLATPLSALREFADEMDSKPNVLLCMGSRVRLLGRVVARSPVRHYVGRVFATAASLVLQLPVYDTQCGAKLFRRHDAVTSAFSNPFVSRWIFDVEILSRMSLTLGHEQMATSVYELPLRSWADVAGSKLRSSDFVVAAVEMIKIWWGRVRTPTPARSRSTE